MSNVVLLLFGLLCFMDMNLMLLITGLTLFMKIEMVPLLMLLLTILTWNFVKPSFNKKSSLQVFIIFMAMYLSILFFFYIKNTLLFFFFFEFIVFPIVVFIINFGYQMERFQASNYFLLYSFFWTLPFFIFVVYFIMDSNTLILYVMKSYKLYLFLFMLGPFLVKLPFFLFHLWLPKAHVESPTAGSIILAAILLKMGGYGIIRVSAFFILHIKLLMFWSLTGAIVASVSCSFQSDSKSLVAYSSIAHMNFMLCVLLTFMTKTKSMSVLLMYSHGFVSGMMFFFLGLFFYFVYSRSMYFSSLSYKMMSFLIFYFSLTLLANFGVPPFISSFSEMIMVSIIYFGHPYLMGFLMLYLMMVCYMTIFLLLVVNHGKSYYTLNNKNHSVVMSVASMAFFFLLNFVYLSMMYYVCQKQWETVMLF